MRTQRPTTTWRALLAEEAGDDEIVAVAPDPTVLDVPFDPGYGGSNGPEFLAWSDSRVYFPVVYDGAE